MKRDRFDFEDLAVFQQALDLLEEADRLVPHFDGHRRKLGWNMFDAAGSVVFNIAESRGRNTEADRAHFLDVAEGSAHETGAGVCIADRLGLGPPDLRARIRRLVLEVTIMLSGMTRQIRLRSYEGPRRPRRPS